MVLSCFGIQGFPLAASYDCHNFESNQTEKIYISKHNPVPL